MKAAVIGVLAMLAIGLACASKFASVRDDLTAQRQNVDAQWLLVGDALQRRAELLPALADAVRSYHRADAATFHDADAARDALARAASPPEKMQANEGVSKALARLLLLSENFRELRADEAFGRIQDELADKENRIFQERRKYNELLERYNVQIQVFPDNLVARLCGFRRNDAYFQTAPDERTLPKVQ